MVIITRDKDSVLAIIDCARDLITLLKKKRQELFNKKIGKDISFKVDFKEKIDELKSLIREKKKRDVLDALRCIEDLCVYPDELIYIMIRCIVDINKNDDLSAINLRKTEYFIEDFNELINDRIKEKKSITPYIKTLELRKKINGSRNEMLDNHIEEILTKSLNETKNIYDISSRCLVIKKYQKEKNGFTPFLQNIRINICTITDKISPKIAEIIKKIKPNIEVLEKGIIAYDISASDACKISEILNLILTIQKLFNQTGVIDNICFGDNKKYKEIEEIYIEFFVKGINNYNVLKERIIQITKDNSEILDKIIFNSKIEPKNTLKEKNIYEINNQIDFEEVITDYLKVHSNTKISYMIGNETSEYVGIIRTGIYANALKDKRNNIIEMMKKIYMFFRIIHLANIYDKIPEIKKKVYTRLTDSNYTANQKLKNFLELMYIQDGKLATIGIEKKKSVNRCSFWESEMLEIYNEFIEK